MHRCWPELGWNCYASIFAILQHSNGLSLLSKLCFCSIFREQIARIWPFAYALNLTRSRLELLHMICFANIWPLVILRICFPSISCKLVPRFFMRGRKWGVGGGWSVCVCGGGGGDGGYSFFKMKDNFLILLEMLYLHFSWWKGRVAVVKRLPVLHYCVVYMFLSFVITEPIPGFFENLHESAWWGLIDRN